MPAADDLLNLLGDDLNRQILSLTSQEPRSADAVAERCDASLPTVYRHVDDLESAGLLTEETRYDSEGNHYKTYAAALRELSVRLDAGELEVELRTGVPVTDEEPMPDEAAASDTAPAKSVRSRDTEQ